MTEPESGEKTERVRLSREVRIGELVAVVVALTGLAGWYVNQQLEPIRTEIRALQLRNLEQDAANLEFKREIRVDLREVRDKLDRLIESQQGRRP